MGSGHRRDVLRGLGTSLLQPKQLVSLSNLAPVQSREWSFLSGGLEPVLQEPFQLCCDVVGSCTGRTSFLQLGGDVRGGEQSAGEAKRIRVPQVSSGGSGAEM